MPGPPRSRPPHEGNVHDSQYGEEEYPARRGWGHSSVADTINYALATHARRLLPFHHDPLHSDDDLAALEQRAHQLWTGPGSPPALAREGLQLTLPAGAAEPAAQAA